MNYFASFRTGPMRFAACLFAVSLSLGVVGCASHSKTSQSASSPKTTNQLLAGMAETDITPPIGYRMAGYFNERFSTGTHDPLQAKALVLRQGNEQVALVFCDLLGPSLHVSQKAREWASRDTGIAVTNIMICATHSHTGPLFDDVRGDYFHKAALEKTGNDPHVTVDYPAFLTEQLVKVIKQAQSKLQPAELETLIAQRPGVAFNRRYHMKDGRTVFNPGINNPKVIGPAGPTDPDVDTLLVENRAGKVMGAVTVFAMHCDSIGGTLYSADYPYFIQQTLRSHFGPDFISAFGAGTCGDINHIDVTKKQNNSGFDVAERSGDAIGQTILQNLGNLKRVDAPSLAVRSVTLKLPLQEVTPDEVAAAKLEMTHLDDPKTDFFTRVRTVKTVDLARLPKVLPMEVQVFRIDADTAIVCLPGEIFVDFGLAIKKASPFKRTFVVSICNQRPAYVPTLKAFGEGSYEIVNSRVKPGGGEAMVDAALRMLKELKR